MDWHRLFGLILTDFFTDSPYVVELEKDLSGRKQLLDVLILRTGPGRFVGQLPDGLEPLALYNLLTFRSHQDALTDWILKELTGHYVNYRKQVSPPRQALLPEGQFRLYAVTSRFPHNLHSAVPLERIQAGVYNCHRGTDTIRVIVAGQVAQTAHNAVWQLFSASEEKVVRGAEQYQQRSEETSTLLRQVFQNYQREGLAMSYTMADFRRDYVKEHLKDLSPEERMEGLSPEDRLKGLSTEELQCLLQNLRPESSARQRKPRRKR
jgi:hypothetical protein